MPLIDSIREFEGALAFRVDTSDDIAVRVAGMSSRISHLRAGCGCLGFVVTVLVKIRKRDQAGCPVGGF